MELRTLGIRRAARRSYDALSDEARGMLRAYAAGVNRWVADHDLPSEYVGELLPDGIRAVSSLPGGTSGDVTSPRYADLLPDWLTNDTYPVRRTTGEIEAGATEVLDLSPR